MQIVRISYNKNQLSSAVIATEVCIQAMEK
jgi:hypothetical protein